MFMFTGAFRRHISMSWTRRSRRPSVFNWRGLWLSIISRSSRWWWRIFVIFDLWWRIIFIRGTIGRNRISMSGFRAGGRVASDPRRTRRTYSSSTFLARSWRTTFRPKIANLWTYCDIIYFLQNRYNSW